MHNSLRSSSVRAGMLQAVRVDVKQNIEKGGVVFVEMPNCRYQVPPQLSSHTSHISRAQGRVVYIQANGLASSLGMHSPDLEMLTLARPVLARK